MKISLKNYIILMLIFFTLLPFVLLRIIAYPKIQSDLKTVIMDNLETVGNKQADIVSTWMRERMKDVIVVANNPSAVSSVKGDSDHDAFVEYLELVVAEYGYKGAFVSDEDGIVTLATSEENVENVSSRDFFKQAIQGKTSATSIIPSEIALTNEFDEKEVGLPTMFVSTPLKGENDAIVGVVVFRIHVATLSNLLQSQKFGKTGETYIVGKDGYMLTESRFTDNLKKTGAIRTRSALELKLVNPDTGKLAYGVNQCLKGKNGSSSKGYKDYAGISVLGVWHWLPELEWGVVTEIDKAEVYGVAYNLNTLGWVLLFGIAFPIVFFAYVVGKKISAPIIELTEATEKMSAGDLTQRVNIDRGDELGVLATSFNTMAGALDKKTKEIGESESAYRELFNALQAGIYQCEPGVEGSFTWVNQSCAEMFGYGSPEEMEGTKVKDIYVDQADRKKLVDKLEKEGASKDFTSYCVNKNGEKFYTERTSNMVKDDKGKPVRIEGVIRDISDRKKKEDDLQKRAKKSQS
ncbi:MAG: MEKHLA domain-containing protein [Candidatus Scalindua sp.]|jgi:PAS domain S-box-containing protein|nr:MEKHLA domain-containing protein [Candidatus Scalindua sp.]